MKSPSYFIWARDICGIQENRTSADGSLITVLQTSVDNEEFIPDAGSYAKSRTRATVELSGWKFEKKGEDTELTYIVKIFLNGKSSEKKADGLTQGFEGVQVNERRLN